MPGRAWPRATSEWLDTPIELHDVALMGNGYLRIEGAGLNLDGDTTGYNLASGARSLLIALAFGLLDADCQAITSSRAPGSEAGNHGGRLTEHPTTKDVESRARDRATKESSGTAKRTGW